MSRKFIDLAKPGLSLMLTATLAIGQQTIVPAGVEHSATWGSLKPEHAGNLAVEFSTRKNKDAPRQDDEELDVIVQYRESPEANLARAIKGGAKVKGMLGDAVLARMTHQAAIELANDPNVAYISPDREVSATSKIDYSGASIGADRAFNSGYNGKGIGIAIIDSGVATDNIDLRDATCTKSRVVYSEDFATWDPNSWDPYGHGTHVAGIAGGNGCIAEHNNKGFDRAPGIAPAANIISLRALDKEGKGKDSSLIAAINRAIALKTQYNIRVLNISAGRLVKESYAKDPLCQAVEKAWKAGIVVVVAAGNNGRDNSMKTNGYSTITSPGNDPFVITVGAINDRKTDSKSDDVLLTFSSKGPTLIDQYAKPDIMAPGANILATKPWSTYLQTKFVGNTLPGNWETKIPYESYFWLSGTSMAAPMVSGAAALLLQKEPTLTPDQVKARLMKTASKQLPSRTTWKDPATGIFYTANADIFTVGAGYLDVMAALNSAETIGRTQSAKSPRVRVRTDGKVETYNDASNLTTGTSIVWGSNIVWGANVVWGNTVLVNGSNVVWGESIVWGTRTVSGYSIVWGTNVVWGNSVPFTESTSINGEN